VLREVSAYSTGFPKQASAVQEGLSPGCPMQCRWKCAFGSMSRFFRKTYCLPLSPRRRAASHSSRWCFNFSPPLPNTEMSDSATPRTSAPSRQPRPQAPRSSPLKLAGACLSYPKRAKHCTPQPRNLDTEQPFSYCYELPTQLRLESVATRTPPPICTSALGSLTALVRRAWGAASD
jgi:hypothetical protein